MDFDRSLSKAIMIGMGVQYIEFVRLVHRQIREWGLPIRHCSFEDDTKNFSICIGYPLRTRALIHIGEDMTIGVQKFNPAAYNEPVQLEHLRQYL